MDPIDLPDAYQAILDDGARAVHVAVQRAQQLAELAEQARVKAQSKISELEGAHRTALRLLDLNPDAHTIEYDEKTDKAVVRPKEAAPAAPAEAKAVPSVNSEAAPADQ